MNKKITSDSYIIGFGLSILLTTFSYFLAVNQILEENVLAIVILGLAFIQLLVQLIFFLHLRHEEDPRWNLIFFLSTSFIIFLVVSASLWIMDNLNYHMTPQEAEKQIIEKELIHREH